MTTNSYGSLKQRPIHPNMSVEEISYFTTNNIPHKVIDEYSSAAESDKGYVEKVKKLNRKKERLLITTLRAMRDNYIPKHSVWQVFHQAVTQVYKYDEHFEKEQKSKEEN